jgi:hypothetical protein
MIKIFRKNRLKFLNNGNFNKYLIYAAGEILLVMIGILLAIQVNNMNELKKARGTERSFLEDLKLEVEANKAQMITVIETHKKNERANFELLQFFDPHKPQSETFFLDSLFGELTAGWTYNPQLGTLNSIIMSGKLDIIQNQELKSYLTSFQDEAIDAGEMSSRFLHLKDNRLDPILDKWVSRKSKYRHWFKDIPIKESSFESNHTEIFNSFEVENIMSNMWAYLKFGLMEEEKHMENIQKMLGLINGELDK